MSTEVTFNATTSSNENPLATGFTTVAPTDTTYFNGSLQCLSNRLVGNNTGRICISPVDTGSYNDDQWAQVICDNYGNYDLIGVGVGYASGNGYYVIQGYSGYYLYRLDNWVPSASLGSYVGKTNGDIIYLKRNLTSPYLEFVLNSTTRITSTDSTYTTGGVPFLVYYWGGGNSTTGTIFTAGNIGTIPTAPTITISSVPMKDYDGNLAELTSASIQVYDTLSLSPKGALLWSGTGLTVTSGAITLTLTGATASSSDPVLIELVGTISGGTQDGEVAYALFPATID